MIFVENTMYLSHRMVFPSQILVIYYCWHTIHHVYVCLLVPVGKVPSFDARTGGKTRQGIAESSFSSIASSYDEMCRSVDDKLVRNVARRCPIFASFTLWAKKDLQFCPVFLGFSAIFVHLQEKMFFCPNVFQGSGRIHRGVRTNMM